MKIIILLILLSCCSRQKIDLPRFVIYEDTFVYRNHIRGEVLYIKLNNHDSKKDNISP